jgi:hypothetical protein
MLDIVAYVTSVTIGALDLDSWQVVGACATFFSDGSFSFPLSDPSIWQRTYSVEFTVLGYFVNRDYFV